MKPTKDETTLERDIVRAALAWREARSASLVHGDKWDDIYEEKGRRLSRAVDALLQARREKYQ